MHACTESIAIVQYCYSHAVIENRVQSDHKLANAHSQRLWPVSVKSHILRYARLHCKQFSIHIDGIVLYGATATPF